MADETPVKATPEPPQEQHVVVNGSGNGSARDSGDGVAKAAQSKENIFFFIPNLIGTQSPCSRGPRCGPYEDPQHGLSGPSSTLAPS